ncbi:MAG: hypothetical protein N3A01_06970 [Bacteroidales bacterium]|nr:hypothetical protein [Bacteroidales bacterium]
MFLSLLVITNNNLYVSANSLMGPDGGLFRSLNNGDSLDTLSLSDLTFQTLICFERHGTNFMVLTF